MKRLTALSNYSDDQGNVIESPTTFDNNIVVSIRGKNNRIIIDKNARIAQINIMLDCDNGTLIVGSNSVNGFRMNIRIGQDSTVKIGADVTTTATCFVSAVEGATVTFGDDVMIASGNQFRSDDAHPIFDVRTGKRTNPARDITIGNHVWFADQSVVMAGAVIGDGSVIGYRSLVTSRKIPNNCVAAGSPARVVRKHIAWERPHLSASAPTYKPDSNTVEVSDYWHMTAEDPVTLSRRDEALLVIRKKAWHLMRRLQNRK